MVPVSCCDARHIRRRRRAFLICRSLPLAPLPPPATGGARVAPQTRTLFEFAGHRHKEMGYPGGVSHFLVPVAGLEPARCRQRWILSPLRLPIPSHRQVWCSYYPIPNVLPGFLLRCPVCALPTERLRCTPTAATRSPRSFRHWRRSGRSPIPSHRQVCSALGTGVLYTIGFKIARGKKKNIAKQIAAFHTVPITVQALGPLYEGAVTAMAVTGGVSL